MESNLSGTPKIDKMPETKKVEGPNNRKELINSLEGTINGIKSTFNNTPGISADDIKKLYDAELTTL
jgi:hypothetical protein